MKRLSHPLLLGMALCSLPALFALGCSDDDESATPPASGGSAGSAGMGGAGGTDGGGDLGIFGDRVPVSETLALSGVTEPVNAVRDKYGMVHIYARNLDDAFRVQGYMMARDRGAQLELMRRFAEGRVAEILGGLDPGQIDDDIVMRHVGLHRVAQQMYDAMPAGSMTKRVLDAFADGVSQWNKAYQDGKETPPTTLSPFAPRWFSPWTGVDTLALGRLQSFSLSYDGDSEISNTAFFDSVQSTFSAGSADPLVQKRAGLVKDLFRFAPIDPATPLSGFPDDPAMMNYFTAPSFKPQAVKNDSVRARLHYARPRLDPQLVAALKPFERAVQRVKDFIGGDEYAGSNNWAVMGSHSQSGNAMVASDPHLGLSSPMVFWPTQIVVQDMDQPSEDVNIAGLAFAGIPGVILGTNEKVAWGATTAAFDVTDVYRETVAPDGSGVMFKGQKVAFQKVSEVVKVDGAPDVTFDVLIVPHHGPLVPVIENHQVKPVDPNLGALSIRWTGHEPTTEIDAVLGLSRAANVDQARVALLQFGVGAQNWMLADADKNIAFTSYAKLPYRDKRAFTWDPNTYTGTLPSFVLDGASGNYEWTGNYLEERYVPHAKNPSQGYLATANGDHVGVTLDNDPSNDLLPNGQPFFLGGDFAQGLREGRILERLAAAGNMITPDDMASIQADHKSGLGSRVTPRLIQALENAEAERASAGAHPDLAGVVADTRYAGANIPEIIDALKKWGTDSEYSAEAGINLDDNSLNVPAAEAAAAKATVIFNAWIVRAMSRIFEDEAQRVSRSNFGSTYGARAFIRLLSETPSNLATYDSATGQSALWDDMDTPGVESPDDRLVMAMLDAVDDLVKIFGADRTTWRWGDLHRVTFSALVPLWPLSIPPSDDPVFPKGFPRHGDQWNVDASNFGIARGKASDLDFSYGSGPVQRFVAELTPDGPVLRNALPGGAVAGLKHPNFRDDAEYWRKNENHEIPFKIDDVAGAVPSGGMHVLVVPQ